MSEVTENPLLRKAKLPGKRIRLPSQGLLYDNYELSEECSGGEIEIFPMTALDEITLNNPDKLLNGDGLVEVFKRCSPNVLKPLELFSNDLDYIMANLHAITFGEQYKVNFTHTCKGAKSHQYLIDLNSIVTSSKSLDPSSVEKLHTLQFSNDQKVKMKPLRVKHLIKLVNSKHQVKTDEEFQLMLLESVVNTIDNVDGISESKMILEWIKAIPASYITDLTEKAQEIAQWGPKLESKFKCKDCGEDVDAPLGINPINFFL